MLAHCHTVMTITGVIITGLLIEQINFNVIGNTCSLSKNICCEKGFKKIPVL